MEISLILASDFSTCLPKDELQTRILQTGYYYANEIIPRNPSQQKLEEQIEKTLNLENRLIELEKHIHKLTIDNEDKQKQIANLEKLVGDLVLKQDKKDIIIIQQSGSVCP
jgi:hypothetical protein